MTKRLMEIDALRGLAVALMVIYHFAFDGWFMGLWELNLDHWVIFLLGMLVRFIFLGLVGVSVVLSSRTFAQQLKRGFLIFGLGMVVTAVSILAVPNYIIWFGILHMIGVSVPVARLFKGRPWWALFAAGAVITGALAIQGSALTTPWLLWLGFKFPGFASLDYFPLLPWLALPLTGVALGHWVYAKRQPTPLNALAEVPGLTWLGRHALAVYMIHQPLIVGALYLFTL